MINSLATALVMGLLGGLHCALMCGPLVIGGCQSRQDKLGYLAGRTTIYALGGAALGAAGAELTASLGWLQTGAMLLLAASLILHGLTLLVRRRAPRLVRLPARRKSMFQLLAGLLPRRGLGLGLATGLLPCGVLAGAFILAASTSHPVTGAAVMTVFSLASLPGLLAPLFASRVARPLLGRLPRSAYGLAWCVLGVFIALRPLLMSTHHHGGH